MDMEQMWAELDYIARKGSSIPRDLVVAAIKVAIGMDPEGAARRASGKPQYDHDRYALAAPEALADCE